MKRKGLKKVHPNAYLYREIPLIFGFLHLIQKILLYND